MTTPNANRRRSYNSASLDEHLPLLLLWQARQPPGSLHAARTRSRAIPVVLLGDLRSLMGHDPAASGAAAAKGHVRMSDREIIDALRREVADLRRQNEQLREAIAALLRPEVSGNFTVRPQTNANFR